MNYIVENLNNRFKFATVIDSTVRVGKYILVEIVELGMTI